MDVARGYVDRQLPISIIVIDYYHWINMGDWSFNPTCWPDPQGMVDDLEELGIRLMVTFWPFQVGTKQMSAKTGPADTFLVLDHSLPTLARVRLQQVSRTLDQRLAGAV